MFSCFILSVRLIFAEELSDKTNRGRLWNIYLGAKWSTKDCLTRAEKTRIRHIRKQLAIIKRDHHLTHEIINSTANIPSARQPNSSRLTTQATTTTTTTSNFQHDSSLIRQNLNRWKELTILSKPDEQIHWTSRKSLKRNRKRLFSTLFLFKRSNTTDSPRNNPQTKSNSFSNQSSKIQRARTDIDLSTLTSTTIAERQNPYLSYFHLPSDLSLLDTLNFQ